VLNALQIALLDNHSALWQRARSNIHHHQATHADEEMQVARPAVRDGQITLLLAHMALIALRHAWLQFRPANQI
jgi:hypothetical protein